MCLSVCLYCVRVCVHMYHCAFVSGIPSTHQLASLVSRLHYTSTNCSPHCPQEPKLLCGTGSKLDVPPEDMELACMENSDSALPEDFPTTASESQLSTSNMASSSTCLLSNEGHSDASQSTTMDLSSSYHKLPPLSHITRCPTQQRMELMAQMPRSHSLPDLTSNIYELHPSQSASPPNDTTHPYPVQFTEKPLLEAHQPKVCSSSSYPAQHSELQMDQHRLPQVSTGNAQPLVKSQISAFVIPQKQFAVSGDPNMGLPHAKEGIRFVSSPLSHPVTVSLPVWQACSSSGSIPSTATIAPRSESTIVSISRLSLRSGTPSPIANPDLLTPPFTPSQVCAPPLPAQPCTDLTASIPSLNMKRNGSLSRQQVHIAPKRSCIDPGTVQHLNRSFKRNRSQPHLESKQPLVVQGTTIMAEQELPLIYHPQQQKQFR